MLTYNIETLNLTTELQQDKFKFINYFVKKEFEEYKKLKWYRKLFYKFTDYQSYNTIYLIYKIAELELKIKQLENEQNK